MGLFSWVNRFADYLPSWLTLGHDEDDPEKVSDGAKNHATLAMLVDASLEVAEQTLEARFPTRTVESALMLIGADRAIPRGRSESAESYARRLVGWRYPRGHRVRGGPFALLEQLSIYFDRARMWTVDRNQTYCERTAETAGGTVTEFFELDFTFAWDSTPLANAWGRFWVGLVPAVGTADYAPDFGDPDLWGGAVGTAGYCVGITGYVPDDFALVRKLLRGRTPWKPFGTRGEWLVVCLDGVDFEGHEITAAEFASWDVRDGDVRRPRRRDSWRYVALSDASNTWTGDPAAYLEGEGGQLLDGTDYYGDAGNYDALGPFTLPSGTIYAPTGASLVLTATLIDDGTQV